MFIIGFICVILAIYNFVSGGIKFLNYIIYHPIELVIFLMLIGFLGYLFMKK